MQKSSDSFPSFPVASTRYDLTRTYSLPSSSSSSSTSSNSSSSTISSLYPYQLNTRPTIEWKTIALFAGIAGSVVTLGYFLLRRFFSSSSSSSSVPPSAAFSASSSTLTLSSFPRSKAREREERILKFQEECNQLAQAGIIIRYPAKLYAKRERFLRAGAEKMFLLSDFDRTLTRLRNSAGEVLQTTKSIIDDSSALPDDYRRRCRELYERYHPLENSNTLPLETKNIYMAEWVNKLHELLCEYHLKRETITLLVAEAVSSGKILMREGIDFFFSTLIQNQIPLVIVSMSFADVIEDIMLLNHLSAPLSAASSSSSASNITASSATVNSPIHRHSAAPTPTSSSASHSTTLSAPTTPTSSALSSANRNFFLFANRMKFSPTNSQLHSFSPNIIHSTNRCYRDLIARGHQKDDTLKNALKGRTHLIVLGDRTNDADVLCDGAREDGNVEEIIRIGFFNERMEDTTNANCDAFFEAYDIVLTNDMSIDFVTHFLQSIIIHSQEDILL